MSSARRPYFFSSAPTSAWYAFAHRSIMGSNMRPKACRISSCRWAAACAQASGPSGMGQFQEPVRLAGLSHHEAEQHALHGRDGRHAGRRTLSADMVRCCCSGGRLPAARGLSVRFHAENAQGRCSKLSRQRIGQELRCLMRWRESWHLLVKPRTRARTAHLLPRRRTHCLQHCTCGRRRPLAKRLGPSGRLVTLHTRGRKAARLVATLAGGDCAVPAAPACQQQPA